MINPGFTEISKWNVSSTPETQLPEFEKVKQVPIVEVRSGFESIYVSLR